MKKIVVLSSILSLFIMVGCNRQAGRSVVQETFIHKYGVPVNKEDWTRNGKDGQVSQLMSDGVIITRTYEKGILNGKVTYTFPNSSTIRTTENYDNGVLTSRVEHADSGVPIEEMRFQGEQIAERTRWYEDGTPAALEHYQEGSLVEGEYRTLLNVIESHVVDGMGTRMIRGNENELLHKDTIQQGHLIERVSYFSNGDPSAITHYEKDLIHGLRLTFMPGGLPNTLEQWAHGKQDGVTTVYQNGEKIAEVPYVNGQKHGVEFRFRDGQTVVEEISWKNGVQHGPRKILGDEAAKVEWYHEGDLVSRPTFDRLNPPAPR